MPHVDEGRLTAWLDGALAPEDPAAAEVARHLEACPDCRHRLREARELRERADAILAGADVPAGPAPGFERLAARARVVPAGGRSRGPRRGWSVPASGLAWAASVALAVTAGWLARDLSLRRGDAIPPFADAPSVREPGPEEPELAVEGGGVGRGVDRTLVDAEAPPAQQKIDAAAERRGGEPERARGDEAVHGEEALAPRAAPAALAPEVDPFHAAPGRGATDTAGAPDLAGCWAREVGAPGLPASIRLEPGTGIATDSEGRIVARWVGFASDSMWIGGEGPETLRLRLEGDRLVGRSRRRPGEDAATDARADSGSLAESVPVVLRRVACDP